MSENREEKTEKTKTKTPGTKAKASKPNTPKKGGGWLAVIETGGKQYKVSPGQTLRVEKIKGSHKEGDNLTFEKVLLFGDEKGDVKMGEPHVDGSRIEATIEKIGKGKKVTVIKYKAKSRYFKKRGHRQPYFLLRVVGVK